MATVKPDSIRVRLRSQRQRHLISDLIRKPSVAAVQGNSNSRTAGQPVQINMTWDIWIRERPAVYAMNDRM